MRQEEAFEFLCRLAQGIASMFGDSCETVVHEMEGERMKNLVIFNGHVSGRSAGSTLSIYGRDTIHSESEVQPLKINASRMTRKGPVWIRIS